MAGCGGGGDGDSSESGGGGGHGGNGGTGTPPDTKPEVKPIVGGTVSAPIAAISSPAKQRASTTKARLSTLLAQPPLDGATPVPDGTRVELARIDNSGNLIDAIASTRTSGGRYHFDFEKLDIEYSRDLIVRNVNEDTSEELRASVVYGVVDIDPITEATFRLMFDREAITDEHDWLLEDINPEYPLGLENVSTYDLTQVAAALRLLAMVTNFPVLSDIETTVRGFLHRLSSEDNIVRFIGSTFSCCGHLGDVGDIGNYYPTERGITWTYDVTTANEGRSLEKYKKKVRTSAKEDEFYSCDTMFESNSSVASDPRERYFGKFDTFEGPSSALVECEYLQDGSTTSYPVAYFPPIVGKTRVRGDDDGDDIVDDCTIGYPAHLTVLTFETVTVPFGTFKNVIKAKTEAQTLSPGDLPDYCAGTPGRVPEFHTVTEWFAPGVGLIKKVSEQPTNRNERNPQILVEELTAVSGLELPIADGIKIVPVRARHMVYSEVTDRIYASIAGADSRIANTVTVINPNNAQIESSVSVGAEAGPLAVSHDGQLLYVGLRKSWTMIIVDVPSLQVITEVDLGPNPSDRWYHADDTYAVGDIEVSPTDSDLVAVAMHSFDKTDYDDGTPINVDIYRDGIKLATTLDMQASGPPAKIEFAKSGSSLYGLSKYGSSFYAWSIDENGLRQLDVNETLFPAFTYDFAIVGGLIFVDTGQVNDLMSKKTLGQFDLDPWDHCGYNLRVTTNAAASRAYFLCSIFDEIIAFDVNSFEPAGTFHVPVQVDQSSNWLPPSLIRVGNEHIAVARGPNVAIINTSVIQ